MTFKATKQYFKNNILPFGGYQPTNFMGLFPTIHPYAGINDEDKNNLDRFLAFKDLFSDLPINYLMVNAVIPERILINTVIFRNGRGSVIPVGLQGPLTWSATFLLDEDFLALRYFMYWFNHFGGIDEHIIYDPQSLSDIFASGILNSAYKIKNHALPGNYMFEDLISDTRDFGKTDITLFALPKTFLNYATIDIPFVRPLNLSTPMLGRTFIMKNTTISRIGSIVFDANNQNTIGHVTIDFISDFMSENIGTLPYTESTEVKALLNGIGNSSYVPQSLKNIVKPLNY